MAETLEKAARRHRPISVERLRGQVLAAADRAIDAARGGVLRTLATATNETATYRAAGDDAFIAFPAGWP